LTESPSFLIYILGFILVLGPLVFVHELGHYLVGRWNGVHAERFASGFGSEIAGWTDKRGTRWSVCALPLGGFVQFAGDMGPSGRTDPAWLALPAEQRNRTFQAKTLWQRASIVLAGPLTNFLFAILILAGFALAYGKAVTPPVIAGFAENSAAEEAGLKVGDRIVSVDGQEITYFTDISPLIAHRPNEKVAIQVDRSGDVQVRDLVIGENLEKDRFGNEYRIGMLGVASGEPQTEPVSVFEAPVVAVGQTYDIVKLMVSSIGQIITGRRSVKELGGPLKIAQYSGEQFSLGLEPFIFFVALISINLGFINLLPIPMLDGGHLLFYLVEAVRRRPASPQVQEWALKSGVALVLGLMIFVTVNDLVSFGLFG
jgi:regulator of sigma E protease